jgi:hypothetical protein
MRKPLLLLTLLVAACAESEHIRRAPAGSEAVEPRVSGGADATLPMAPAAALAKSAEALRARGFVIAPTVIPNAPLDANSGGPTVAEWAICPQITVRDPFAEAFRFRRTSATDFDTRVTIRATPVGADQTRLTIRTLNIGNYQNSLIGTAEQASCRSTGVLENELLAVVRGT